MLSHPLWFLNKLACSKHGYLPIHSAWQVGQGKPFTRPLPKREGSREDKLFFFYFLILSLTALPYNHIYTTVSGEWMDTAGTVSDRNGRSGACVFLGLIIEPGSINNGKLLLLEPGKFFPVRRSVP